MLTADEIQALEREIQLNAEHVERHGTIHHLACDRIVAAAPKLLAAAKDAERRLAALQRDHVRIGDLSAALTSLIAAAEAHMEMTELDPVADRIAADNALRESLSTATRALGGE